MGANISQGERPGGGRPFQPHRFTQTYTPGTEHTTAIHRDKKKKASKFATLKKKLIKARRHSKSYDHTKSLRELLSGWNARDIHALVAQYESGMVLKELAVQASLARAHAPTFREDLCMLYDSKYFTDVDLVYQGTIFPVHRAILSVRCPYFRDLLSRYPEYGSQIPVIIRTPGVDVTMFSTLLRYLYTGEFPQPNDTIINKNLNLLIRLADEFGTPNALENDLRTLLETGMYADALLVFSSRGDREPLLDPVMMSSQNVRTPHRHELRCHKAILAARSPFFRNLLLRRERLGGDSVMEQHHHHSHHSPTCIELDESVIPRRYARVLLHTLYLDSVDMSCIVRTSVSMCSLSEVQAMVAGKSHMSIIDEAMEIYQIGQFLEFPILSQGCEDVIAEHSCVENLVWVLQWSSEPHGSPWVQRQALQLLREDFLQVAHSTVLHELTKEHLLHAIQSDLLQSSEVEVLMAVMKWGEHQLIKHIEEREPNLLSHTAHSVSRKGIKKRDLNDIELREILADLLPHIRTDHVIPRHHDVLTNAIKRGLVSVPPSHMLGDDSSLSSCSAWVRGKNSGVYTPPRVFLPYFEEAKCVLEERIHEVGDDSVRLRTIHISGIPDTLYMVEQVYRVHQPAHIAQPQTHHQRPAAVDIIAGTIPVPSEETVRLMQARESELRESAFVQRAVLLPWIDRHAILCQLQLRVVREFGLPDSSVEVLSSRCCSAVGHGAVSEHLLDEARYHTPRKKKPRGGFPSDSKHSQCVMSTPVTPTRSYSPAAMMDASTYSDSILCEAMPDIALATASMDQISLNDCDGGVSGVSLVGPTRPTGGAEMELDLGDGTSHNSGSRGSTIDRKSPSCGTLYI